MPSGVALETHRSLQRDFKLLRIGPLQRRPPRHQRRPFRRVSVELRDFALRHALPLAGAFDCGRRRTDAMRDRSNPRRRERKDCRAIFAPCEVARPASVRNPARTEAAGSSVTSAEAAIERSRQGRSRRGHGRGPRELELKVDKLRALEIAEQHDQVPDRAVQRVARRSAECQRRGLGASTRLIDVHNQQG